VRGGGHSNAKAGGNALFGGAFGRTRGGGLGHPGLVNREHCWFLAGPAARVSSAGFGRSNGAIPFTGPAGHAASGVYLVFLPKTQKKDFATPVVYRRAMGCQVGAMVPISSAPRPGRPPANGTLFRRRSTLRQNRNRDALQARPTPAGRHTSGSGGGGSHPREWRGGGGRGRADWGARHRVAHWSLDLGTDGVCCF